MCRAFLILLLVACSGVRAGDGIDLRKVSGIRYSITAATADRLVISIENPSATPCLPRVERGSVFAGGRDHGSLVALRSAELTVAAKSIGEMSIPAAALSSRAPASAPRLAFADVTVPELAGLLDYFQAHDDLPGITAQLLVLCVTEDVSFAKWKEFLARQGAPPLDEVATAIDALGVLRRVYPQRTFALATDAELKLRALRNPVARAKAMQLYGLALPDVPTPPELGTLLHTKPGDNCPICRQRALMQPREDGL